MKYTQPEAGGVFEHRGLECECHGDNIVFAKPYHSTEPFRCVACMLEEQAVVSALEERLSRAVG
jgi:hypothetical protein